MSTKGFKSDIKYKYADVATTANVTLSGLQNFDGQTGAVGDVVLVWQQTDATQNGLYRMASSTWRRHGNFNTDTNMRGVMIEVLNGTLYGKKVFQCTNPTAITVGATSIRIDPKDVADNGTSGFLSYSGSGNYWSCTSGGTFTMLRAGEGRIKGARVVWPANQTVNLSANKGYFITINSAGTLVATDWATVKSADKQTYFENFGTLLLNNILLFSIWYDGLEYVAAKNCHPYSYPADLAAHDHFRLGTVFTFTGANISPLVAANRTVQLIGADLIDDHGVLTNVPDGTGNAISILAIWQNGSGVAQRMHRRNFTVSGVGTAPTAGAIYRETVDTGNRYTVLFTNAGKTLVETWMSTFVSEPVASGTLVKVSGTGDTNITYSAVVTNRVVPCSYLVGNVPIPLGTGGATRYGIYAIYAYPTDMQTPSVAAPIPQYFALMSATAYNSAANAAASLGSNAAPDMTQFVMPTEIEALEPLMMGFAISDGSSRGIVVYTGSGFTNGVKVYKQTGSSSFSAGAVAVANAINVSTDTTLFDGFLTTADTDMQKALNTLDDWGHIVIAQEDIVPIEAGEDGAAAPDAAELFTHTNGKVRVRKFSGSSDNDVTFVWPVPSDINTSLGIKYQVMFAVTEATGPSAATVSFELAGYSVGTNEDINGTFGTAVASSATAITQAQYTRGMTTLSTAVTVTGIAAGETAFLNLKRLGSDSYAQKVGVVNLRIFWWKTK